MKRALIPGRWRTGAGRPALASCTGSCDQGRRACDCSAMPRPVLKPVLHPDLHRITLTELDLELPHDADRVIAPPQSPPDPMKRRRLAQAWATAAISLLAFGALLCCSKAANSRAAAKGAEAALFAPTTNLTTPRNP